MNFNPPPHHGGDGYLTSLMLIATPSMGDPRFVKSVIYLCAHTPSVAMGLVVNKPCHSVTAHDLFERHQIDCPKRYGDLPIMMGGPVETSQGFVLHSADYNEQGSLRVDDNVALTATVTILQSIIKDEGPDRYLLALGYAGWSGGQLDREVQNGDWLTVPPDLDIIFDHDIDTKWDRALASIGVGVSQLVSSSGHA